MKKIFIGAKADEKKIKGRLERLEEDLNKYGIIKVVNRFFTHFGGLTLKDKLSFFRLFATMVNAGVNIIKTVSVLRDQIESPKLKIILEEVEQSLKKGETLADSLMAFPKDFSDSEVSMIRAGEASGKLYEAMINIANQVEKFENIRKKVKGAMMYPMVVIIILIAVMFALMTFVVPKIKEMFTTMGAELPTATKIMITMSDFLVATGGPLNLPNYLNMIGVMFVFVFVFLYFIKTERGKFFWHLALLKLPVFGILNKKVAISKMCRGISTLTSSGISIIKALNICSELVGNELYKKRILQIVEDIKMGMTISDNIKGDDKFFPPMVVSMIGIGEQTAQLGELTLKMATFYEEEVDDMIKNMSSLLEPLVIVLVGLVVSGVVISVMLPMLNISDLAELG